MTQLRLITLGGVRVLINGQDITSELPIKLTGILIYLARHGKPKSREHLAEYFWGDRSPKQAYGNLRTALSKAKPLLADALIITHQEVGVNAWLDANEFESFLQNPHTIGKGLDLYAGDFMTSFFIGDAIEFENWQLRETEKLHESFIQATLQHIGQLQIQSRPQDAIVLARRAIALSPLREDIQRALIQLYQSTGDKASALRQYHAYRDLLWEELGVEPDAETQAILQQLEKVQHTPIKADYPLPPRMTSFIGHQDSVYQIEALLKANRLVTIAATGGTGKTRLALEIAYHAQDLYPNGVCFIDLSDIAHPNHVLPTIANALRLPDNPNLLDQVTNYLHNRQMLLILDNFEHVLDASDLIAHWMANTASITFLITSREPLKLYGETIFHLQMLSLQESCQLFYERVRAVQPNFQRTEAMDAKVRAICQRLDGLPLAIELASTRARTMSIDEILAGLNRCLELLATDLRNMPRRQRALFSAIEWSYSLLTPEQAFLFRRLAVFRGGWTRDVIRFIAPDNRELDNLVDKNLIRRIFSGTHRYNMLETIREYAYYQLEKTGELIIAKDAMVQWMLHFSEDAMHRIRTTDHAYIIKQVKEEDENIRMVLDYLATQPAQLTTYARIVGALSWIWNFLGICTMPFQHAKRIIAQADQLPEAVRASIMVGGGHSAHELGQYELAESWQREALHLYQKLGDKTNIDYTEFFLSGRIVDEIQSAEKLTALRKNALENNDLFLLSLVNINLGATLLHKRQLTQSIIILEEGIHICEEMDFVLLLPIYYLNVADTYSANREVEKAFKFLERAYAISQAENHIFTCIISLMELCDLCYRIGRFSDIESYVSEAEQLIKQLPLPMLSVRVQFWRAVVASFTGNMAQFYGAYKHIFRYIHISDVNMSFYILNSIFYLILMMVKRGKSLEQCALLMGAIEAYGKKINIVYSDIQQKWRDSILEIFSQAYYPYQEQGKLLNMDDVFRESDNLLEQLIHS